ncbi:MAG TPA: fatty acid desaturase [Gammaproteobacteria bacterium]
MEFSGLLSLSWWEVILYTLGVTHITIAAVTIFLHRHQAHRALELHPLVSHFFRFWLWLTTGMVTKEWAAVHRKHHAMCETEADPHSPQIRGLRAVLLRGAELYREEADRAETLERYGKGTPDDWLERHLYGRHSYLGITLMLLLDLALLGPIGLTVWAVQMLWSPIFAAGVINGVGHYYGYRNAESPDASTNIVPWGILIGGEELHNNHHAWPGSARLSYQWWEFDIGWLYIRLLQAVGLARVKRVSPPPVQVVPAAEPDVEAVHAIINYRLQVLARYGSQVIKRIHREELRRVASNRNLKGVFKRARGALLRDESQLDETARRSVGMVLGHSQALAAAVEFRRRLQAIWQQAAGQPEKALAALQQWCREAEASGNRYLQQFARQLAGYRRVGER